MPDLVKHAEVRQHALALDEHILSLGVTRLPIGLRKQQAHLVAAIGHIEAIAHLLADASGLKEGHVLGAGDGVTRRKHVRGRHVEATPGTRAVSVIRLPHLASAVTVLRSAYVDAYGVRVRVIHLVSLRAGDVEGAIGTGVAGASSCPTNTEKLGPAGSDERVYYMPPVGLRSIAR